MEYKPLGDYIKLVDLRNRELGITNLLGVSIEKRFIPSIANIVGTDLSSYKVVKNGQFAYGPVTSRNGEKISIALLNGEDCIISSSYTVFEVTRKDELDPEYLMLWFSRPEFDRYARYRSHGSVREIFGWDEMCAVELPVPDIEKQRKIVKAYKTITDRIALKQRINDNLTATGIAIIEKYIGNPAQINKTQFELDNIELPPNWQLLSIGQFCKETKSGATPSRDISEYWNSGDIPWVKSGEVHNGIIIQVEEKITQVAVENSSTKLLPADTVLMAMYGVTAGEVGYLAIPATTNQAVCGMVCNSKSEAAYLFFSLLQSKEQASRLSNGGAQDNLSKGFIDNIILVVPTHPEIEALHLNNIISSIFLNSQEILKLSGMQNNLLSQLSSH